MEVERTLVVWCPDWPVTAMALDHDDPAAVIEANRIVSCTDTARSDGVRRGQRRREAQQRCPTISLVEREITREFRAFESVLGVVENFSPRVEVVRPGVCAVATRGPSRYFGGDQALAKAVLAEISGGNDNVRCRIGVADGMFAASLAARTRRVSVVEPGGSGAFLAPLSVHALDRPELTDVLARLGLRSLGAFAALDVADVIGRFGAEGVVAHRLAAGLDAHPLNTTVPTPDLSVDIDLEPPLDRIDQVAFVARSLAEEFRAELERRGSVCTRMVIEAETEHGERIGRLWREENGFSAAAIVDRTRWQIDGWLNGPARSRPTGGISRLVVIPDEVVAGTGRQLGFWGGESAADARAKRAVVRLETILGHDSVKVAEWEGGRRVDRFRLISASGVDLDRVPAEDEDPAPWPGTVPSPLPAVVHDIAIGAILFDSSGDEIEVTGRGLLSGVPVRVTIEGHGDFEVDRWAGPWLVDERWWDSSRHHRLARIQVVTGDETAHLLKRQGGRWLVEADYG